MGPKKVFEPDNNPKNSPEGPKKGKLVWNLAELKTKKNSASLPKWKLIGWVFAGIDLKMKNVSLNDDTLEMPSDITLLVLGVNKTYSSHQIIGMSILHAWYDLDPKIRNLSLNGLTLEIS